jgi:hypothetical protein
MTREVVLVPFPIFVGGAKKGVWSKPPPYPRDPSTGSGRERPPIQSIPPIPRTDEHRRMIEDTRRAWAERCARQARGWPT